MASAHEKHNELAKRFVMEVVRETKTSSELMVVIESTILAAMLVGSRVHNLSPAVSSAFVEAAVQRALERYVDEGRS